MSSTTGEYPSTARTQLHRLPQRGSYDREVVHAILDEAWVAHVGFVHEGQPYVLATAFVRVGECLYFHGVTKNRMLGVLAAGASACVTVTLLDGLVLARSAYHHSMNYRSVVVLGVARDVLDAGEKQSALDALVERVRPGRSREVRPPNDKEFRVTRVLALELSEVSAKVRASGVNDDPEDLAWPCWAGVIPLTLREGAPMPDVAAVSR